MPLTIDSTNSVYFGLGFGLAPNFVNPDTLTIASDGFVGGGLGGIYCDSPLGSSGYNIFVNGYVLGNGSTAVGIQAATSGAGVTNITVGSTGVIQVRGGGANSMAINGVESLNNSGTITNDGGDAVRLDPVSTTTIINSGTISAGASGRAILASSLFDGTDTVTNSGLINGIVSLGGLVDTVTNTGNGRITKSVLLGAGADQYTGSAGSFVDTVFGDAGNDTLRGGGGNDILNGGLDGDTIFGGLGNDTLTGGLGNDFFVFNTTLNATTNKDNIVDYNVAADTIRLENTGIFSALGAAIGTLSAAKFFVGTAAHDADDRIIYNKAVGDIYYDGNGNAAGGLIKFAHVTPNLALTNADFFVI